MDVDRQFENLSQLIKQAAADQGYLSVRAHIVRDEVKTSIYWVTVTGISKNYNLKAHYKITLQNNGVLSLKFQYCSPRVASHEIERAITTFKFYA